MVMVTLTLFKQQCIEVCLWSPVCGLQYVVSNSISIIILYISLNCPSIYLYIYPSIYWSTYLSICSSPSLSLSLSLSHSSLSFSLPLSPTGIFFHILTYIFLSSTSQNSLASLPYPLFHFQPLPQPSLFPISPFS